MLSDWERSPEAGLATRRIAAFLKAYCGLPFCPQCLERECEVAAWQIQSAVERLARRPEFARSDWWCALCLQRRLVIEARDEQGLIDRLTGGR